MAVKFDSTPHPLRRIRQQRGLSIEQVAERSGLAFFCIQSIETRRRTRLFVDQMVRLAEVLDVEFTELIAPENMRLS